jgi:hypothetical protein
VLGASGITIAGLVIFTVGVSNAFVPEDLAFMQVTARGLDDVSPRLIPLIAHDRVGFGGAVSTLGLIALVCVWCGPASRALWEALAVAGTVSLAAAITPHVLIGYTDPWHLAPVILATGSFVVGLVLTRQPRPITLKEEPELVATR